MVEVPTSWYLIGNSTNLCAFSCSMGSISRSSLTTAESTLGSFSGPSSITGMPLMGTATSSDSYSASTFSLFASDTIGAILIGDSMFKPSKADAA